MLKGKKKRERERKIVSWIKNVHKLSIKISFRKIMTSKAVLDSILDVDDVQTSSNYNDDDDFQS